MCFFLKNSLELADNRCTLAAMLPSRATEVAARHVGSMLSIADWSIFTHSAGYATQIIIIILTFFPGE